MRPGTSLSPRSLYTPARVRVGTSPCSNRCKKACKSALKSLRGKGKLTEGNMRDGLRLVEQSLLEADVSYSVVQDFMAQVSESALGERVLLALDPTQQVVGIVHEELIHLLGPVDPSLHLRGT